MLHREPDAQLEQCLAVAFLQFIKNGATRGAAFGVPGLESALGREGVLTAYYGNPRQIMFTVGYKL